MDNKTKKQIKMRISQLETENTAFRRDYQIVNEMANDRVITELNKLLDM